MLTTIHFKKAVQTHVFVPGVYKIECFGAQGGRAYDDAELAAVGGLGAKTSGILNIKKTTTLYFYTGGKGGDGSVEHDVKAEGGYNGGGKGGAETGGYMDNSDASGGGGGATDVRYEKDNLDSRIMVAGGGSGGALIFQGAPGGDQSCKKLMNEKGYTEYKNVDCLSESATGEDGKDSPNVPSSGAGGGWRGGKASEPGGAFDDDSDSLNQVSSGGSSYVSGMTVLDSNGDYKIVADKFYIFEDVKFERGINEGDGYIQLTTIKIHTKRVKKIHKRLKHMITIAAITSFI